MNILVIGGGGREHALVWRLAQDPGVTAVTAAPGSDGMCPPAERAAVDAADVDALVRLAVDGRFDLVVVGPEAPLVAGLADRLAAAGVAVAGPGAAAARLEGSKIFAKDFMARHGIPTARYEVHDRAAGARRSLESGRFEFPVVIKADGLAAGKGVVIAADLSAAQAALAEMMERRCFGAAGDRVVVEEFLQGEEASFMALTDGEHVVPLPPAQDHKRVFDDDRGPNTGGMGAYSDDRILPPGLADAVLDTVIRPTVRGMTVEGHPFRGVLYAGLMLTAAGPRVLEFNVRFGDPETQAVLPRLRGSLAETLHLLAEGRLDRARLETDPWPAVCVVLASGGYPGEYAKGRPIHGLELAGQQPHVTIFHAGTRREGDRFVTAGGRVLGVTARGADLDAAVMCVYEAASQIYFEGMHYRRDIALKGLRRYR
ncbi:MAG TPA: phosphoribosylamine--glycine ligase [Acidobacteriota bacterium]|nr:phosphoribosylamine--glycine ligase [Acidobacteriota bacterium]HQF86059.1 phosphoribosylamine--glycine ligase [Acidobacteriota bacterium]HQG90698.1 phosphoribosylamine--glycine ligase [Acidobacteriota bacterium]HQK86035.1 phosphoribosylamine--glycine ligase [Acidobacteriota bacterium]